MARIAARRARELREQWLAGLTGMSATQSRVRPDDRSRGTDYRDVSDEWVCNRKKAYPTMDFAKQVAARMNANNSRADSDRPEFYGVVVVPYACGRCGFHHLGR